jgi:hypothetical protein
MGKKTNLNEATVRRFMKLAKLPAVNERFFNEEEEPVEEPAAEELPAEEEVPVEEPAAEEAPAEGEAGPDEVEMAERVASAVMVALEDELGVSTDVAVPEEGGEEAAAEEPAAEEPAAEEEEMPLQERIVNEVTRRVAARLLKRQRRRK